MTEQDIQRIERIAGNRPIVKLTNVTVREFCRAARERNAFRRAMELLVESETQDTLKVCMFTIRGILSATKP